jgi:hypothetical protein
MHDDILIALHAILSLLLNPRPRTPLLIRASASFHRCRRSTGADTRLHRNAAMKSEGL